MRLFLHELRTEQLLFWRNREAAFFTFFLPVIFFLIFGVGLRQHRIKNEGNIRGAVVPRGRDDRLRRRGDLLRRARDHDGDPARVGDPQAHPRDAAAGAGLPARRARLDVRRLPDRGRADHRLRAGSSSRSRAGQLLSLLAVLAIGAVCFAAMGLGITARRPLGGGLLCGDQRDLPADGDHLRHVLHAGVATRSSCA